MSASAPQHAAGLSGRELDRTPRSGVAAAQPLVFERRNGERLHFRSVESFRIWWDAEQARRAEAEVEGIVGCACDAHP